MPEQQRGSQGFVPGEWDADALAGFANGPGIFVAEDKDTLVAVLLTSENGARTTAPAQRTAEQTARLTGPVLDIGPLVVTPKYRRRGIARMLLSGMALMLGERYPNAVVWVDNTNQLALKVLRALGMKKHTRFTIDDRAYTVFVFEPKEFMPRRAK